MISLLIAASFILIPECVLGNLVGSSSGHFTGRMAVFPASRLAQLISAEWPNPLCMPMPVTTYCSIG